MEAGEIFGMLGPNGAGKTTTTEIIEGLRTTDSGSVTGLGLDVARKAQAVKTRVGISTISLDSAGGRHIMGTRINKMRMVAIIVKACMCSQREQLPRV